MKPQSAAVLRLLEQYPATGVSQQDAIREAQCYRLAARIADLRADGYAISSEKRTYNGRTFALYRLVPQDEQLTVGL